MEGLNQFFFGIGFIYLKGIGILVNILYQLGMVWVCCYLFNVVLFYYVDYQVDLVGELFWLVRVFGIVVICD